MEINPLATFRKQFGISQSNLAMYLSVSLSLLKMAETNKRELPSAAFLKFSYLQNKVTWQNLPKKKITNTDSSSGTNKMLVRQTQQYCKILPTLEKQLRLVKSKYEQANNLAHLLMELEKTITKASATSQDKLWIEMMQAHVAIQVKKNGIEVQQVLQWKIDVYTYGIQRANELSAE